MLKKLLKLLLKTGGYICMFLIVVILVLTLVEARHTFMGFKQQIGINNQVVSTHYSPENRISHIQYMKTFNYQNLNIRYIDHGPQDGPVIFLIHGTPTNSWLYRKIIPLLAQNGYRIIVPDMVGFGVSSMPQEKNLLTTQQQAKRINALARHLDIDSFTIGGHDQGSLRVQEFLISYPQKVSHLVLFNGIYERSGFHPPVGFGQDHIGTQLISKAMGTKALGRIFTYGAMLGGVKNFRLVTPTMVNGYLYPLLHGMSTTYYYFISDFDTLQKDVARYQKEISKLKNKPPILVVRGNHDPILVGKEQIPLIQDIYSIQENDIYLLDDAAHFLQEEQPEFIAEKIHVFLQENNL